MDVIMEYLGFVIFFAFVIYLCIASEFANIAAMKGHKSGYFGWCFFFGPIGCMMVVALPDLYASNTRYRHLQEISGREQNGLLSHHI